jgi:predicted acetyltransferase
MARRFAYGPPADAAELAALLEVIGPTFNVAPDLMTARAAAIGAESFRTVREGGRVAGGAVLLPMGQYFGGRSVAMTGIGMVAIAPEHRGHGAAIALMREIIGELHEQGTALSTLYPALFPLYRQVGYELAGGRFEIQLSLGRINVREPSREVRAIENDADDAAMKAIYAVRAAANPGNLDRSANLWSRVRNFRGRDARGVLVVDPQSESADGYAWFLNAESKDAHYGIHVTDVAASSPVAGRRLLQFLADFRSIADPVTWHGSDRDVLLMLLPDRAAKVRLVDHWMVRIVNVKAALEQRGWPAGVRGELHLELRDELVPANQGRWTLEVAEGAAQVRDGGRGDVALDVRDLAPLFTGFRSPQDLALSGQLQLASHVKDAATLRAHAATVFAGPTPWMSDMF